MNSTFIHTTLKWQCHLALYNAFFFLYHGIISLQNCIYIHISWMCDLYSTGFYCWYFAHYTSRILTLHCHLINRWFWLISFRKTSQYLYLNVVAVQAKMRRILISFMKSFKTISSVCYLQFANCVWFHFFLCFLVLTCDCLFVCLFSKVRMMISLVPLDQWERGKEKKIISFFMFYCLIQL